MRNRGFGIRSSSRKKASPKTLTNPQIRIICKIGSGRDEISDRSDRDVDRDFYHGFRHRKTNSGRHHDMSAVASDF